MERIIQQMHFPKLYSTSQTFQTFCGHLSAKKKCGKKYVLLFLLILNVKGTLSCDTKVLSEYCAQKSLVHLRDHSFKTSANFNDF